MRKLTLSIITITTLTAAQCPYERSVYSSGYDLYDQHAYYSTFPFHAI